MMQKKERERESSLTALQFLGTVLSSSNGYTSYASCDNLGDFVKHIKDIGQKRGPLRIAVVSTLAQVNPIILSLFLPHPL